MESRWVVPVTVESQRSGEGQVNDNIPTHTVVGGT